MTPEAFEKTVSQLSSQYEHQAKLKAADIVERAFANATKGILNPTYFKDLPKGNGLVEKQIVLLLAQYKWENRLHYRIVPSNGIPASLDKTLVFSVFNYHGGELP